MRLKWFLSLALTIVLVGCAPNSIATNQGLKKHKDMKIAYTSMGQKLAKEFNFYFRTLSRDKKTYGMKFIANDLVIEDDIDWVQFDNNEAVYQIENFDDYRDRRFFMLLPFITNEKI